MPPFAVYQKEQTHADKGVKTGKTDICRPGRWGEKAGEKRVTWPLGREAQLSARISGMCRSFSAGMNLP